MALSLAACGGGSESDSKTKIVAAFYPLAFLAEKLAPDADVTNITPAGAEPHDLELTARDAEARSTAPISCSTSDTASSPHSSRPSMAARTRSICSTAISSSVRRVSIRTCGSIRRASPRWPERYAGSVGDARGPGDLVAALEKLDTEFRVGLAECDRREIVTTHAAFGYLADAYGLDQIALTGLAPEAEPSARDLEHLVATVEHSGATTVFFEPLVSPDLAETVAREAGAETASLDPLEGLSEDDLEAGADYFTVMRDNLRVLRRALGCR